jgi:hypothetical protein
MLNVDKFMQAFNVQADCFVIGNTAILVKPTSLTMVFPSLEKPVTEDVWFTTRSGRLGMRRWFHQYRDETDEAVNICKILLNSV